MYVLCAPHLEIGGWHNNAEILQSGNYKLLLAHKRNTWLALGATVPFTEASCGYVGVNDGWTDLADNYRLDWQYEEALDGRTGRYRLANPSRLSVSFALAERRLATLDRYKVTGNSDWSRIRGYSCAPKTEEPHSIHFSLARKKIAGKAGTTQ
jgi:Glucodextranase, domain N